MNVMRQTACLILTQPWLTTLLPLLIARRRGGAGRASTLMMDPALKNFQLSWLEPLCLLTTATWGEGCAGGEPV